MPASEPMLIESRKADLGHGLIVRRVLPWAGRRMVGPFIFFDHAGPVKLEGADARRADVRPHPHIGLSTVSYLLSGKVTHRDSLGFHQTIVPGDVNWMTAGRGIAHSERFDDPDAFAGAGLELIQTWVALPTDQEECAPSFQHVSAKDLPQEQGVGLVARLLVGQAYGATSPVRGSSPLYSVHLQAEAGAVFRFPPGYPEHGAYVVRGAVQMGDVRVMPGSMIVCDGEAPPELRASEDSTLMLVGGEPVGSRHVWWNFVSSRRERIEQAKSDWREGRIALPPDDQDEFIPLPD